MGGRGGGSGRGRSGGGGGGASADENLSPREQALALANAEYDRNRAIFEQNELDEGDRRAAAAREYYAEHARWEGARNKVAEYQRKSAEAASSGNLQESNRLYDEGRRLFDSIPEAFQ